MTDIFYNINDLEVDDKGCLQHKFIYDSTEDIFSCKLSMERNGIIDYEKDINFSSLLLILFLFLGLFMVLLRLFIGFYYCC